MAIAVALGTITVPLLFVGEEVLVALGQDPELARIGEPFLIWSSFGMPFMFLSFVLRQYIISHQRPLAQVIAVILALCLNIALNEVFVRGIGPFPAMGLGGVALATSIVYTVLCAGLVTYIGLVPPFRNGSPFQRLWVMDWAVTLRLLRIGVPIGLTIVAEAGMFIAVTFLIGLFSTAGLAAARSPTSWRRFLHGADCGRAGKHGPGRQLRRRRRQGEPTRSASASFWLGTAVTSRRWPFS